MNTNTLEAALRAGHDLKSPLQLLYLLLQQAHNLSHEQKFLFQRALYRIHAITHQLMVLPENNDQQVFELDLLLLLNNLILEKSMIYKNCHIHINSTNKQVIKLRLPELEILQILSVLIDNSAESYYGENGEINIFIEYKSRHIVFEISDSGCGMSAGLMKLLGKKRISYGKENQKSRRGFGLYSVIHLLETYGGKIRFCSQINRGTSVKIKLPTY